MFAVRMCNSLLLFLSDIEVHIQQDKQQPVWLSNGRRWCPKLAATKFKGAIGEPDPAHLFLSPCFLTLLALRNELSTPNPRSFPEESSRLGTAQQERSKGSASPNSSSSIGSSSSSGSSSNSMLDAILEKTDVAMKKYFGHSEEEEEAREANIVKAYAQFDKDNTGLNRYFSFNTMRVFLQDS